MFRATPVASFILLILLWTDRSVVPGVIAGLMVLPVVWGNLCRGSQHQDSGEKRSCATGNVQSHFLDSYRFLPASHARQCGDFLSLEYLCGVERADVVISQCDGRLQFDADFLFCFGNFFLAYQQGVQLHFVEFFFVFEYGFITLKFDAV